jgi:hypothetical protein
MQTYENYNNAMTAKALKAIDDITNAAAIIGTTKVMQDALYRIHQLIENPTLADSLEHNENMAALKIAANVDLFLKV